MEDKYPFEIPPFLKDFIGPHEATPRVIGKLPNGKPILLNPDGSISTVFSDIVTDSRINAGKPSLIPTVIGGKFRDPETAIKMFADNAGHDPDNKETAQAFNSIDEGVVEAKKKSRSHGDIVNMMKARGLLNLLGIDKDLDF